MLMGFSHAQTAPDDGLVFVQRRRSKALWLSRGTTAARSLGVRQFSDPPFGMTKPEKFSFLARAATPKS